MTVQLLVAPNVKLVGVHCKDEIVTGGSKIKLPLCEFVPSLAVIITVCVEETEPAVAENCPLDAPAPIVMPEGTDRNELLSLKVTETAEGVVELSVTVHVEVAGVTSDEGLQLTELIVSGVPLTVILPPVALTETALPAGVTPDGLTIPMDVAVVTDDESVTVTFATTPLVSTFEFKPVSRHRYDPALPLQRSFLPAAVAALPACAEIDAMSVVA